MVCRSGQIAVGSTEFAEVNSDWFIGNFDANDFSYLYNCVMQANRNISVSDLELNFVFGIFVRCFAIFRAEREIDPIDHLFGNVRWEKK